jgi:hypothetical protein
MRSCRKVTEILIVVTIFLAVLAACSTFGAADDSSVQTPAAPLAGGMELQKEVSANLGWQAAGVRLRSGEIIQIQFISGEIRDAEAIVRGRAGVGWACEASDCCEPMPFEQRDALIGQWETIYTSNRILPRTINLYYTQTNAHKKICIWHIRDHFDRLLRT